MTDERIKSLWNIAFGKDSMENSLKLCLPGSYQEFNFLLGA
jgi:hypothetical protein